MSKLPPDQQASIARIVDEHLNWIADWHRAAFYEPDRPRDRTNGSVPPPRSFALWFKGPAQQLAGDQPAIDRLAVLYDQLHKLARLVVLKSEPGKPPAPQDYQAVLDKYVEFMSALRRFERAFAAAASGLDLLTGLRSRHGLLEDLEREQNRCERMGTPYCVAVGDIDRFKAINDTYGHDMGDRVLAATADCIGRRIRSFDDAYRLGGEEFLVCLKGAHAEDAYNVIERLRVELASDPLHMPGGHRLAITASFGIVEGAAKRPVTTLLKLADQALYQAKEAGRNRVIMLSQAEADRLTAGHKEKEAANTSSPTATPIKTAFSQDK